MYWDPELMSEVQALADQEFQAEAGTTAAAINLDWKSLILEILSSLLGGCIARNAAELKQACANCGDKELAMVRIHVRDAFRDKYGLLGFRRYNGEAAVRAVIQMGKKATEEQIARAQGVFAY